MKLEAEGQEFAKIFEITQTIYSNSERSEQVLVTDFKDWNLNQIFFTAFITITNVATGNVATENGPKPHFMEKCFPYVNKYARSVMDLVTLYVR